MTPDAQCPIDCRDNSCLCAGPKVGGMRTNGGCRCGPRELRRAIQWWRAALRERDAEHEVVLATARAEALGEAVEECDRYIEQLAEAPGAVRGHTAKAEAAKELERRLRALLEEAGK